MNFIKILIGEKNENENDCCGVEIKVVESKDDSCCNSENEKDKFSV